MELKDKVISVHDEVMPRIGSLKTYQKELLERANQMESSDEAIDNHIAIQELRSAAHSCEEAYDNMFVWMRQFKSEYSDMTEEEVEKYLTDQLKKIEKVRKDVDDSMHEADSLLSRY
ncbi:hypothetical protein [Negadavirga shengliensis]|uniref:Uncharacterized protein n=1 Tax=Negadavirga shengliensis TaxID=1389218 RepID=A0ABV9SZ94_9BACT